MDDAAAQIVANLRLLPVPLIPAIRLYRAEDEREVAWVPAGSAPYWAYVWPGGAALAQHVLSHTELVRGRRVLDLGAGSGLVGITATFAGAEAVTCAEIDPIGRAAIALNAAVNGVALEIVGHDLTAGAPPETDVVLVGDLLYDRELANAVNPFLARCRDAGIAVLLGDPGRGYLPSRKRLRELGSYGEGSVDDDRDSPTTPATVFAFD